MFTRSRRLNRHLEGALRPTLDAVAAWFFIIALRRSVIPQCRFQASAGKYLGLFDSINGYQRSLGMGHEALTGTCHKHEDISDGTEAVSGDYCLPPMSLLGPQSWRKREQDIRRYGKNGQTGKSHLSTSDSQHLFAPFDHLGHSIGAFRYLELFRIVKSLTRVSAILC